MPALTSGTVFLHADGKRMLNTRTLGALLHNGTGCLEDHTADCHAPCAQTNEVLPVSFSGFDGADIMACHPATGPDVFLHLTGIDGAHDLRRGSCPLGDRVASFTDAWNKRITNVVTACRGSNVLDAMLFAWRDPFAYPMWLTGFILVETGTLTDANLGGYANFYTLSTDDFGTVPDALDCASTNILIADAQTITINP